MLPLILPTLLSGALMVFMRTFADYGTPMLIGENYNTLPVVVYKEFLSEIGSSDGMAAAISIIAIVITTAVFLLQKVHCQPQGVLHERAASRRAEEAPRREERARACVLLYSGRLAIMPQCYVIYSSFRNTSGKLYTEGFGLGSYKEAFSTVGSSIVHTYALAFAAIFVIVLVSLFVSYVVVRRRNVFNAAIDVVSMFPETVMGSILGIALLTTFNKKPLLLTGGAFIMILSYTIRRMPYTIRSSSAILRNISPSIEEASINLGASDFKTFFKVTVPMMMSGVISGAILSWIMIITELSTSIILYTSKTKTMTLEIYSQIIRGNDGVASAISAILTFSTIIALAVFFKVSGKERDYDVNLFSIGLPRKRGAFCMGLPFRWLNRMSSISLFCPHQPDQQPERRRKVFVSVPDDVAGAGERRVADGARLNDARFQRAANQFFRQDGQPDAGSDCAHERLGAGALPQRGHGQAVRLEDRIQKGAPRTSFFRRSKSQAATSARVRRSFCSSG